MNHDYLLYRFETTQLAKADDAERFMVKALACIRQPDGVLAYSPEHSMQCGFMIVGEVTEEEVRRQVARCGQQLGAQIALDQAISEGLIHEEKAEQDPS